MDDYMDSQAAPSESENASVATATPDEDPTPENKLALVQSSFFRGPVKPGDRETVEVVDVYENEVSVRCVGHEDEEQDDSQGEEMGMESQSVADQPDEGMGY